MFGRFDFSAMIKTPIHPSHTRMHTKLRRNKFNNLFKLNYCKKNQIFQKLRACSVLYPWTKTTTDDDDDIAVFFFFPFVFFVFNFKF